MQVMRAKVIRRFKPMGFNPAGVAAEPLGGEAVAAGDLDAGAHHSTLEAGSLPYPRLRAAESFLLLPTAAAFPLGLAVSKVAQPGHHHLHPRLLLPR